MQPVARSDRSPSVDRDSADGRAPALRRRLRPLAMALPVTLAGLLVVGSGPARAAPAQREQPTSSSTPTLSRSEAEEHVYRYLAQDLPGFVGMRHRREYLAELEADPPRFDAEDRYHFNPPGGILEFEYDRERGALIVRAAIHRYKGRQQGHGLSFEQIGEAVHAYAHSGADLGGGRLETGPELDGVFLRLDVVEPPRSTRQLARRVDRMIEAANRWTGKTYLEALRAYAATLAPPASATATAGPFSATMALTANPALYARVWSRPPGALRPWHVSVHTTKPDTELLLAIHIVDPAAGPDGLARVEATTRLVGPDGVDRGTPSTGVVWHEPPPPAGHFQLTEHPIGVGFSATEPEGTYRVLAEICDRVAEKCVELAHPIEVVRER